MLIVGFPAAAFDTNCFVVAPEAGEECIVVDPGIGVVDRLHDVLTTYRLRPSAVVLTHGHADHVWSVTPVCAGTIGAYIHPDDRYRLVDPIAELDPQLVAMLSQQFGQQPTWREPDHIVDMASQDQLELAGLTIAVAHAPGHTEGSVILTVDGIPEGLQVTGESAAADELDRTTLTGDVLFAGAIGRTDLPGGDDAAMQRSLREVILPLADSTLVLPGHGAATTMRHERSTNPYLQRLV